jgi:acetyltransferase-like isoleucine patch superfamily enzyme
VGNFVTIGPGVRINGYINIEDDVFIGAQATIKPGSIGNPTVIGKGSKIGMGAVVLGDVQPNSTVVGNPARKLQ